jgi:MarR family transcriptional regulator, organic hydroperoxide resistance regulator
MVISILVIAHDDASVITALHRATHASLLALSTRLSQLGLTPAEQNVLAVLADGRSRSVGDLATATGTRPTTLTSVLDRLADKQLLTRQLDDADRRSFLIELTTAGREAAGTVRAAVADVERHALAGLRPAQIAGFHAVTRALTEVQ